MMSEKDITQGNLLAKLLGHGSIYFIGNVLTRFIGFLLLPVYTRLFNTSQYGIIDTLNSISMLLVVFYCLYLDSAYVRFYFDYKDDPKTIRCFTSTIFWFIPFWGGLIFLISIVAVPSFISQLLNHPSYPIVPLAFGAQLIVQIGNIARINMRVNHRSLFAVTMDIIQFLISIIFVLIFVWKWGWGVEGKFLAFFIAVSVYSAIGLFYLIRNGLIGFEFNKSMLLTSLAFSIPLIPNLLGGWINGLSDRIVISAVLNVSETGLYSIARQIGQSFEIFPMSLSLVYSPMIFAMMKKNESDGLKRVQNYIPNFALLMLFLAFIMSLYGREIVILMTPVEYHRAWKILPVIVMALLWAAMYTPLVPLLSYKKRTILISSGAIIQALLNLILNITFIPRFGIMAAAWTTLFSVFVYFIWMLFWSRRDYPFHLPLGRLLKTVLVFALLWAVGWFIPVGYSLFASLFIKFILIAFSIVLLVIFRCFGEELKREIRYFWTHIRSG